MFTQKSSSRLIVIALIMVAITAIAVNAKWGSGLSFGLLANTASAAPENAAAPAAPLLGTTVQTVCNTGTPTFATVALAVADANANFPTGSVTYDVCAGHTETLTGPLALTATGTGVGNEIIFQKSGAGANPLLTAYVGTNTPALATHDDMFRLIGSDFVIIDGIDLTDPNTTNPASMEGGYVLYKASLSDGAQNNTIKNCTITLNRVNNASGSGPSVEGSRGIEVTNATAAAAITALTPTTAAGANSNNKFYTNTIQNANYGIVLSGFAATTPFTAGDVGNDVGGSSGATGNIIKNYGGAVGATNPAAGVRANNQFGGVNISYNTIDNNDGAGVNHVSTLRGIFGQAGTSASATINNNTVTVRGGATTSTVSGIENGIGSTAASNTIALNNNVVNVAYTTATTGVMNGIINSATAATVNINGNTVQGISGSPLAGTGTHIMIETGSPTTVTTNSNIVQNLVRNSATTGILRGIKTTSPTNWTANGNTVTNVSFTTAASTGGIDGIYSFSSAVNVTITNNSITNFSTPSTGLCRGIVEFGVTGLKTIQGNTVSNFSTTAGGAGGASFTGISESTGSTNDISGNTIFALNSTGTTGGTAGSLIGITVTGGVTNNIYKNKIYDISSTSTNPAVNGITSGGGTTANIYNNLVGDLRATATTALNSLNGLNLSGGTTINAHYNTVYLNATSSGANFGSSAVSGSTAATITLRNNAFVNLSTPNGTGLTVAYRRSTTTLTSYGAASNNNDFYAGTPGASRLIFNDGTNSDQTLGAYQARVASRDNVSFTENPPFLSTTGSSANFLHIDSVTATQLESGGSPVSGVTDDFDGNTRNATTPDVGADEFAGVVLDLTPPAISYTALGNTSTTTNRVLAATITDASGVAGGANSPRIYFKKSTDAGYVSTQCGGTYSCTIDYTLVGGGSVVLGDTIQYFVVAQDTPGNVGANPSAGFSATNVNTVTSPPTTPSSYNIVQAISGNFNVGTTETYTSLTRNEAAGIFRFINENDVVGNITISITSDLTTEDGAIALNAFTSPHTITIMPSGAPRVVSGATSANAMIRTNGASRVTIDGSTSGGTDRSLTISNTSVTTPQVVRFGNIGTTPMTNNTLKNSIIINGVNTSSAVVITDTAGAAGYWTNITIQNNDIRRAFIGVFSNAAVVAGNGSGTLYTQNKVDNSGADAMLQVALYAQGLDGATISNNTIGNFVNTDVNADTGIWLATGTANTTVSGNTVSTLGNPVTGSSAINYGIRESSGVAVSGNVIRQNTISNINHFAGASVIGIAASGGGVLIERNDVSGINNLSTGTFGAYGIDVQANNNSIVRNNFVSNVTGNMTGGGAFSTTFGLFGIRIGAGTGHQVYNNSVNMYGLRAGTATTSLLTAAICVVSTTSTGLDIRNNIFANNITGGTTSIANVAAYLPSGGTSAMNLTWNNNSYYFGTDAAAGAGQAGTTAGTNFFTTLATLAAYSSTLHAAATNDNASLSSTGAVPFVTSTNLHLLGTPPELNTGVTIASVTNDFDGESRPMETAYEIGADEYVVPVLTPTSTSTFTPTSTATDTATATNTATPTATSTCEPLTFNFANTGTITIPGGAPTTTTGPASPYPSDIVVSGLSGNVYAVKVKLNGIGHTYPDDIDVLLVGPGGQNAVIMSDVGGSSDVTGVNLTLDSDAATSIPDETILTSGTYRPTNIAPLADGFPAPAPATSGGSSLAPFVGQPANGTWSLYVYDAFSQDHGVIAGGWELLFFTDAGPCATATNTPVNSPTNTDTPTATNTSTPTNTATNTPTPPDTVCAITEGFENVPGLVTNEGWYIQNNSQPLGIGSYFQGNPAVFPAHLPSPDPTPNQYLGVNFQSGSGVAVLSNWALTPPITLQNGGVLTFYTRTTTGNPFPDRLQVRMSTNGTSINVGTLATDVGDFTTLLLDINPTYIVGPTGYPEDWTLYTVTISGVPSQVKGRLAFRYFVEDGGPGGNNSNYIGIDTLDYNCSPATPTNTATNTATNTPTPADTPSVAGTITYGNPASATTKFISNATVTGTGSVLISTTTGAPGPLAGQYTLTGFGSGNYVVSVAKTTGQNGITAGDASRTAQHAAGTLVIPTARQRISADATGNGNITALDASQIARFAAGLGAGTSITNQWRFFVPDPGFPTFPIAASPTTRSYTAPIGVNTAQDYIGILIGEVTGNWTAGPLRPANGPERSTAVNLPRLVTPADSEVVIPVSVNGAVDKGITSYEFDLRYDPAVIQPQAEPVELAGTVSRGLIAVANANEPGLLRVVMYGVYPIDANGLLLNLRFNAVGAPGTVSPLTFERIMLNEGDPGTLVTDGAIELSAAGANQAEISGRLLNTMGQGMPMARVTLTDTKGESRYVMSNGFGAYRFGNLQVGQTYTLSVESRNATFTPLTVSVTGQSVNVDMIAAQ